MSIAAHVFLQTLRRMDKAPPADIRHYQAVMLARLVEFAARMAPDHGPRLGAMIAGDDVDMGQWERIPVLTRADLARGPDAFCVAERPEALGELSDGRPIGTTGAPITGPADPDLLDADSCVVERLFDAIGVDGRLGAVEIVPAMPAEPRRKGWSFQHMRGEALAVRSGSSLATISAAVAAIDARTLIASVDAIRELAAAGPLSAGLTHVVAFGFADARDREALVAWAKAGGARIGFALCVPETGTFATVTDDGQARFADGVAFCEVVDDSGHPVRPGREGRLVVTPLYAFTRPLIRFETGLTTVAGPDAAARLSA